MRAVFRLWSGVLCPLILGCATSPTNPSFPVSREDAARDLKRMENDPHRLERPLVVITGFMDPGFAALSLRMRMDGLTHDNHVIAVTLAECLSIEGCRRKVMDAVNREFPSGDPAWSTEVDVIGYSLGGLVARYAALPTSDASSCRLRIARLFTISSPHQGAADADRLPLLVPLQKDLRSGSALLARVNETAAPYRVYCYARLGDRPVGCENAAPPGQIAWWVPTPVLSDPHNGAFADERILADIARRLRSDDPLTCDPPAPLPVAP